MDGIIPITVQKRGENSLPMTSGSESLTVSALEVCRSFRVGGCKNGDLCKFAHTSSSDNNVVALAPTQPNSSSSTSGEEVERSEASATYRTSA